jgi:hypothetical protein
MEMALSLTTARACRMPASARGQRLLGPFDARLGLPEIGFRPLQVLGRGGLGFKIALDPVVVGLGLFETGLGALQRVPGLLAARFGGFQRLLGLIQARCHLAAVQGNQQCAFGNLIPGADPHIQHLAGDPGFDAGFGFGTDRADGFIDLVGLAQFGDCCLRGGERRLFHSGEHTGFYFVASTEQHPCGGDAQAGLKNGASIYSLH